LTQNVVCAAVNAVRQLPTTRHFCSFLLSVLRALAVTVIYVGDAACIWSGAECYVRIVYPANLQDHWNT